MFRSTTENYLFVLLGIFTIPYLVWKFARTDKYAPLVVVQILAGIVFGPGVVGHFFPGFHGEVFAPDVIRMMAGASTWAVVLFVATAGIEINTKSAIEDWKETTSTALSALLTPMIFALPLSIYLSFSSRWMGETAQQWQFALAVGMAMSVTALPILVILLDKMKILKHQIGERCLRYASFDDVAIWTVFALIMLEWDKIAKQSAFAVAYAGSVFVIRKLVKRAQPQDRFPIVLAWVLACALAADWSGLHYIVGGFLAGLVINEDWLGEETLANFRKYVLILIMPIFFLSTGLRTDWEINNPTPIFLAIILFAVQATGKIAGVRISAKINRWNKKEASIIGWLLQTKALIEIIFATIMLDKGVISGQMFTALLFMAILSTAVTTPVVSRKLKRI